MKVSIHQPQYLPWIPFFTKIIESDLFIFLDSVDFQKNGIQNRNMIKTSQGEQWLTVPVKHQLGQKIQDIEVDNSKKWRKKHLQTIIQSYSKAEYFDQYKSSIEEFYSHDWLSLSEMNIEICSKIMTWLNIDIPIMKSSEIGAQGKSSELILNICSEVGATRYISGIGGKNYLDINDFEDKGIYVDFQKPLNLRPYPQLHRKHEFMSDLSAIDIIFNCGNKWSTYLSEKID